MLGVLLGALLLLALGLVALERAAALALLLLCWRRRRSAFRCALVLATPSGAPYM